jgi:hypothetical protein
LLDVYQAAEPQLFAIARGAADPTSAQGNRRSILPQAHPLGGILAL